jgi:hypothetical protein
VDRSRGSAIEGLLHQSRQAELPVGSRDWFLAVLGAVAAERPAPPLALGRLSPSERRAVLESRLLESGLAYGTGAVDRAVEMPPGAGPGLRAFAQLVAGLARLCAQAAALCGAPHFLPQESGAEALPHDARTQARRTQLLAVMAAMAGEARAAAQLMVDPLGDHEALVHRLAGRVALRLSRRFLADGGPFEGLPLHNGLCAIEVRACATLALASFRRGRLSAAAARVTAEAALHWRLTLVELLGDLTSAQEHGPEVKKSMEQVLRSQRLPAREARLLKRALADPRPIEELGAALRGEALRRFALEQVLLAALVDGHFDRGEVAFVERLATATGATLEEVARVETAVTTFYAKNRDALAALRRAETPEGLPHALTTRLQEAVTDNLDRILMEIRKTGELAELLAKAAAGGSLSDVERRKVRDQLIDLAKTIPALAIFAAPGGMLLLPILIKLLPFNLLPSSFADPPPRQAEAPLAPKRAS